MQKPSRILRLDASASPQASTSKQLGDRLIDSSASVYGEIELRIVISTRRLSFIDGTWVGANFTARPIAR